MYEALSGVKKAHHRLPDERKGSIDSLAEPDSGRTKLPNLTNGAMNTKEPSRRNSLMPSAAQSSSKSRIMRSMASVYARDQPSLSSNKTVNMKPRD